MLSKPLHNGVTFTNSRGLSAGSDSPHCSSNRQSEVKLKLPTKRHQMHHPRFKNVIFRHHYVMQKNSRCIETEQSYLCRVLYFNRQNLILTSLPKDQATAYGIY